MLSRILKNQTKANLLASQVFKTSHLTSTFLCQTSCRPYSLKDIKIKSVLDESKKVPHLKLKSDLSKKQNEPISKEDELKQQEAVFKIFKEHLVLPDRIKTQK